LLAQTFDDLEILISDNGSTDGTEEIARSFVARDPRFRYERADENRGASWNYQNVVRQTTGEYFKWATHDDLLAPTYIERCVEALDAAPPSVVLVYPRTQIIDEEGNPVRVYDDNLDIRLTTPHARLGHLVRHIVMANASFGLIRRSALAQTRLLDAFPSADYIMMAELALLGEFWELPEVLFSRREHRSMSRFANRTAEAVAEWFKPGSGADRSRKEYWRVFFEHFNSIRRLPLGHAERVRCVGAFAPVFLRRHGRRMLYELIGRTWHNKPAFWARRSRRR
jgi:glycosyltransferase involved in cell wall biosynthesis